MFTADSRPSDHPSDTDRRSKGSGDAIPAKRIGAQPCRYSFILNPHTDVRVSKCRQCNRPTYTRKFPLFIHVEGFGPLVLGKTCRYCARCELIVAHQDELEAQLAHGPAELKPGSGGYLVIGTMDRRSWQRGLHGGEAAAAATLKQVADFKQVLELHVDPGGWGPA
jgi:predicted Rdx family selenoprotein